MTFSLSKTVDDPLQAFFYNNPLPCLILQKGDGQILHANVAAATFFNVPHHNLQGQNLTCFLAPEPVSPHALLKKFDAKEARPFTLFCKAGNATTPVQVFQMPIPGVPHQVGITLAPFIHPESMGQEDLMAEMVNESSDVLTTADLDFKPLTWSKTAERLYGIPGSQAIGKNVQEYLDIQYNKDRAEEVHRMTRTTGTWRGEVGFTRPADRQKITLLVSIKLIKDSQGEPLHYVITGTDISDRKEAEAKLLESENRFRELADTAPVGIWMKDFDNDVVYINKQLAGYTGVCPHVFTEAIWLSLVHPHDVDAVLKKFQHHFEQRRPVTLIYRLKRVCGAYHWVQDSGTPRLLPDGTFLGYIGSIIDINETKRRETQLQYQATILNNILDSVVTTDLNFIVQSWNSAATEIYGVTAAEAIGKPLPPLTHFHYIGTTKEEAFAELINAGIWKGEIDVVLQGKERNFLFTVAYITDSDNIRIGIMALGREITDRKRAEQKLKESESFYRSLIADSVDGKLLTTAEGTITFASPSIQNILGYNPYEIIDRNVFEFVHPDDMETARTAFENELAEKPQVTFIEVRVLKPDGSWLWCMIRGHNLLAHPHIGRIVISFYDDSLRKQAADALVESEQRFRALIKDLKLGITLENAEGSILMYNKAMSDMFLVPEAVFESSNVYELFKNVVHEDESPFAREEWPMLRAAQTKKPVDDVTLGILLNGTTERLWLSVQSNPVLDETGAIRHIISSFSDITERKKLTQGLIEKHLTQQRLLTQATLDGQERERKEIGKELHDNIGQQLATTKLYLDLAREAGAANPPEMLNRAIKSIMEIINEVRIISHTLVPPALGDLGLIDSINDLIGAVEMVQRLHIEFTYDAFREDGLPENGKLMLYRIVQEALNNIVKHAQARSVKINLARNAQFITLAINDDGQGFAPDKIRKGLGLNNIRNRAELFGGTVAIIAAPGAGCTISIRIPEMRAAGR